MIPAYRSKLATMAGLLIFSAAADAQVQRTAEGLPDLTGTYDIRTITPLQRRQSYGDNLYLTAEQVQQRASRRSTYR